MTEVPNILGGLLYGFLCDKYGRVWPYVVVMLNIAIFGLASAFSPNFVTIVCLRLFVAFGTTSSMIFLYSSLTEVLPVRNRGKVLVSIMLVQSLGICASGGLAWWVIPKYPKYGWRFLVIATSVPSFLVVGYRIIFSFESPRFLVTIGKYEKAYNILQSMARMNGKNMPFTLNEVKNIQLPSNTNSSGSTLKNSCLKFGHIFKKKYLRTTICMSIIYVTHSVAYFSLALFTPTILHNLIPNSYFTAFVGYLGQIPGVLLTSIIVEWRHVGRLNSMRLFAGIAIVTLILFAIIQNEISIPVLTIILNFSTVPLTALMLSYMSEYYPTMIRGSALAYFNNLSAIFGFFFPYLAGYVTDLFDELPWLFTSIYAIFYVVVFLVSLCLQQETLHVDLLDK